MLRPYTFTLSCLSFSKKRAQLGPAFGDVRHLEELDVRSRTDAVALGVAKASCRSEEPGAGLADL